MKIIYYSKNTVIHKEYCKSMFRNSTIPFSPTFLLFLPTSDGERTSFNLRAMSLPLCVQGYLNVECRNFILRIPLS